MFRRADFLHVIQNIDEYLQSTVSIQFEDGQFGRHFHLESPLRGHQSGLIQRLLDQFPQALDEARLMAPERTFQVEMPAWIFERSSILSINRVSSSLLLRMKSAHFWRFSSGAS